MADDEFTRLFKYLSDRFDRIDKALKGKAETADMHRVLDLLDKIIKQQEINDEERLVMGHQLDAGCTELPTRLAISLQFNG
jgi:hypothetical protein